MHTVKKWAKQQRKQHWVEAIKKGSTQQNYPVWEQLAVNVHKSSSIIHCERVCVWHCMGIFVCVQNRNNKYTYIQKNHSENCNIRLYLSSSDNQKRLALLNCSAIYFIADKSEINDMERMNSQPKKNNPARQVAHIILHNHTCNMYMREKNRREKRTQTSKKF